MISANEARQKSECNIGNNIVGELYKLEILITEAILKGASSILYNGYLQRETIAELKRLGYRIKWYLLNEPCYSISWGE